MQMLSVPQPWATLLSRGVARFVVRDEVTDYRGTIAIHASDVIDAECVERMGTEPEFAECMASQGCIDASDFAALPRSAIVGVAVIADVWSLGSLEEVATEGDAILIGDVVDTAVFWELAESVVIAEVAEAAEPTASLEPMPEQTIAAVQDAARAAGAQFDEDGMVFWPVAPTASLAGLIGEDAIGDREITRRVWAYVVEQDLQDAEDHAYVYLDDALRSALEIDADGMPTIEFTECVVSQMRRVSGPSNA